MGLDKVPLSQKRTKRETKMANYDFKPYNNVYSNECKQYFHIIFDLPRPNNVDILIVNSRRFFSLT